MHYFLLLSNAHLLENGFYGTHFYFEQSAFSISHRYFYVGDSISMQECLYRLFSVLCTLCQSDIEIRKMVSEVVSNTMSSTSKINQALFGNLIEQMKNLHTTTSEQANHYQLVLSNARSFLQSLCALPIRLYKDKR
jgi:hypothetical protein